MIIGSERISDSRSEYSARSSSTVHPVLEEGEQEGLLPTGRANGANLDQAVRAGTAESFFLLWDDTSHVGGCLLSLTRAGVGPGPSAVDSFRALLVLSTDETGLCFL